ncbi:hypothetical protein VTI74DRAFT_4504 [Chaetomium olivicolor]
MKTREKSNKMPDPQPIPPTAHSPHKSVRDHLFHTLPPYTGPYRVGFLELELPVRQPRHFSHIKRNGEYALKLDTVLFAVYYPADLDGGMPSSNHKNADRRRGGSGEGGRRRARRKGAFSRAPWLPRPRASTCKGYAKFFRVPRVPMTAYIAVTSMLTKLPAYRNAKLSVRWPDEAGAERSACTARGRETDEDAFPEGEAETSNAVDGRREKPRFPVVIFSHGLGGSRTLYSSVCGELASFGLVVVAMEHRDGSGARTFVNKMGKEEDLDDQGVDKSACPPENEKQDSKRREKAKTKPYYKIDYLFPKNNARDTAPQNPNGVDKELRAAQIEMRLGEIEEAFYTLGLINSGKGDQVRQTNLRKGDNVGSSSAGLDGLDWQDWAGRLDLDSITMMGHSFGGAITVQALRSDKLGWITQGILLDPWGPALPECPEQQPVHKPVLSIGSEAFMHWAENFACIEQLCQEARAAGTLCWMTAIRGSTHLSQTDFAVLYPNWMSWFMKTMVTPERAIYLTVHSVLEFLKLTQPGAQTSFARVWTGEKLLNVADPETKVVSDHRPDDKWVAARLKIPNEFSMRVRGMLRRSPNGVVDQGAGSEIWCHQSPGVDTMERYMRRNDRLSAARSMQSAIV